MWALKIVRRGGLKLISYCTSFVQKETIRRQFERVEREAGEYEQKVTELENQIEAAEQQLQQLKSRSHNEIVCFS